MTIRLTVPDVGLLSSMGPEINVDSILALEKQIEEGLGDIIQLKRARNSLLNISTLIPPELLGQVFRWNIVPDNDYGEPKNGSYNFLLVCHHWFEVASSTPELWAYWGSTLEDWSLQCQHPGNFPLDLALRTYIHAGEPCVLDEPLRNALRDRAARDSIRSIYLDGAATDLLDSVISSITPDGEGIRRSSIESLRLECNCLGIFKFLDRHRFPKLRALRISTHARIPSWDHLKLQATSLTTLSLKLTGVLNSPTTSQLFSILASYPNLQDLSLYELVIPHDVSREPTFRAPLRQLKKLYLVGGYRRVFQFLDQLEHPDLLDSVVLHLSRCTREAFPEFIEPYLRDRLRRDVRFQRRLGIRVSCLHNCYFSFEVNAFDETYIPPSLQGRGCPSMSFSVGFVGVLPGGASERLCLGLIALTRQERVVDFAAQADEDAVRALLVTMPNIESLCLTGSAIFKMYPQSDPLPSTKLLPYLRYLQLDHFTLPNSNDWGPLIAYLTHQASGGRRISLRLRWSCTPVPPEVVVREIKALVEEFTLS